MQESSTLGKYQLLKKLAVGGMAEVFLARQTGLAGFSKFLVLKRILPELAGDQEFVTMFLDEARLAAGMSHPNVVQIFDLGEADGTWFIAMEYIAGPSIFQLQREHAKRGQRMPHELAARIIACVAEGLEYAHALKDLTGAPLNLVHRDVTPSNVLCSYGGMVKLVDFGIAKAETATNKTNAGSVKGKTRYLAPEQITQEPLDGRCDLWAAGMCLYELITGVRAVQGENELAMMRAILDKPIPSPRTVAPDVPVELDAIVTKCLTRDRAQRFATGAELSRALEGFMKSAPLPSSQADVGAYLRTFFHDDFEASERMLREFATRPPATDAPVRPLSGSFAVVQGDGSSIELKPFPINEHAREDMAAAPAADPAVLDMLSFKDLDLPPPPPHVAPAEPAPAAPPPSRPPPAAPSAPRPPRPAERLSFDAAPAATPATAPPATSSKKTLAIAGGVALALVIAVGGWLASRPNEPPPPVAPPAAPPEPPPTAAVPPKPVKPKPPPPTTPSPEPIVAEPEDAPGLPEDPPLPQGAPTGDALVSALLQDPAAMAKQLQQSPSSSALQLAIAQHLKNPKAKADEPPLEERPPSEGVTQPGSAWVGATTLPLHPPGKPKGPALANLPFDTVVDVLSVDGPNATVTVGLAKAVTYGSLGSAADFVEKDQKTGVVEARWLMTSRLDEAALVAKATEAAKASKADEALVWQRRAFFAHPTATARGRWLRAALDAKRPSQVAEAALAPTMIAPAKLEFAWGCLGDPAKATWASFAKGVLPRGRDFCLTHADLKEPCPGNAGALTAWQKRSDALEKLSLKPSPLARFVVDATRPRRLWFYSVRIRKREECTAIPEYELDPITTMIRHLDVPIGLAKTTVLVPLDGYDGMQVGVVGATSEGQAREWLRRRVKSRWSTDKAGEITVPLGAAVATQSELKVQQAVDTRPPTFDCGLCP